jgi:hypothetical protein
VLKLRTAQPNKTDNLDDIKLVNNQSMTKTITATFDGEYLRPDNPVDLQPNQRYLITIEPETETQTPESGWSAIESLAGTVEAPADWSIEHDHYLYGSPKQN